MTRNSIKSVSILFADDYYVLVSVVYFSGRSRSFEFSNAAHYLPISCIDIVPSSVHQFIDSCFSSGRVSECVFSDEYWINLG